MTSSVQAIVDAARRELGAAVQNEPVRASCPGCGKFVVAIMVVPSLLRSRCDKCRVDVIVLVSADRQLISATERF